MEKSGVKTSEFWGKTVLQLLTFVAAIAGEEPPIDETTAVGVAAALEAVYVFARTVAKTFMRKENSSA